MENFRILNRRPLELPSLETLVPIVDLQFKHYTNEDARVQLRRMPPLLYNRYSGWYFALSNKGVWKMTNEQDVKRNNDATIHLAAVANLDILVTNALLGYSKSEPLERINSAGKKVSGNKRIKANHRFYAAAKIGDGLYSIRLLIREYMDGSAELGEEANAYALTAKKMRALVSGSSVLPASHEVTTAHRYKPPIKDSLSCNIAVSSSRCGAMPPTDANLTETKIQTISDCSKISLRQLIKTNLKAEEEALYNEREKFDYRTTGTDRMETIFDRLRLTSDERNRLCLGEEITVHNIKIRSSKIDAIISFHNGKLILNPID